MCIRDSLPPIVLLLMGQPARFGDWIYRALTFLVISCPCALVISIPLSFFGGIGGASACGILVKMCIRDRCRATVTSSAMASGAPRLPAKGVTPVSYTHLDVYKRQG